MKGPVLKISVAKKLPPPDKLGKAGASAPKKAEDSAGKVSAASDIIAAVKSGDSEELASALADFVKLCSYDGE